MDYNAFAKRAIIEMLHVTTDPACSSWNPGHFLDTAEMMHAVAVGYDWLYNAPASIFSQSDKDAVMASRTPVGSEIPFLLLLATISVLHRSQGSLLLQRSL